ncbi:MAG TPA: YceI family protein [Steroidobacteraceae bacterium]|nr:YceI family protein [Steroidobacteraceae bacterium]
MAVPASARLCTALCAIVYFGVATGADPGPATHYSLDPGKSRLDFEFVQAGARNQGHFGQLAVSLDLAADNPAGGKLDVQVPTSSIDTGDKERDDTLKGADLFDIAKYPQARFTSSQITRTANGYEAVGKLTLRGVTRDQRVAFVLRNAQEQGKAVTYLTGKTTVKRLDFGIGQGDWKSTEWVGNEVLVSYSLRLVSTPH